MTLSSTYRWGACAVCLFIILCPHAGLAQTPSSTETAAISSPQAEDDSPSSVPPRNGYAPDLTSTPFKGLRGKRAVYNPIKSGEDPGQLPEIEMFVGESRVFPAPGVGRIAVGNGQILTAAALDKNEVILFANGVGTSSLFVWNDDGRYQRVKVNIVAGDTTRIAREVAAFLSGIPHAKASIIGDKVIVEGQGLSDADQKKVAALAKQYPQIVNFTDEQGWEKMVMLDVKVVEFPMNESENFGISWTPSGGGSLGAVWRPIVKGKDPYQINIDTGSSNTLPITDVGQQNTVTLRSALNIVGAVDVGLNARLNALIQTGKGAILAEPHLTARNGSEAKFVAGGEIPYGVTSLAGSTVLFKEYGIKLTITPVVDRAGRIRASVAAEVSSIDPANSTAFGPALLTRKTETNFNVLSGQTMVLSGLLSRENSTDIDKVPLLGDIPILGALFRSKNYRNKETELVVFVTPTVVDSQTPGLVDRVEKTTQKLQNILGPKPYLTQPVQPGRDPAQLEAPDEERHHDSQDGQQQSSFQRQADAPRQMVAAAPVLPLPASAKVEVATLPAPVVGNPLDKSLQPPNTASSAPARSVAMTWAVALDGLALRSSPNIGSAVLAHLPMNTRVQVAADASGQTAHKAWTRVSAGGATGWVATGHLRPVDSSLSVASVAAGAGVDAPASMPSRLRVTLPQLAMRAAPDVNAPIVIQVPAGATVEGLQRSADGLWWSVKSSGRQGWVAAQWVEPATP